MVRGDLGDTQAWQNAAGRFPADSCRGNPSRHLDPTRSGPDATARDRQRGHRARQRMITANLRMVVTLSAKYAPALGAFLAQRWNWRTCCRKAASASIAQLRSSTRPLATSSRLTPTGGSAKG